MHTNINSAKKIIANTEMGKLLIHFSKCQNKINLFINLNLN